MRKARAALVLALAATVCAILVSWHSDQPRYKGKPLTAWLQQHAAAVETHDQNSLVEADEAIRHIGPDAFPTILKWISMSDSAAKKELLFVVGNMGGVVKLHKATDYHAFATYTCGVLKAAAKPIVPDLAAKLHDADPLVRSDVAFALDQIGPASVEAVPALLEALGDQATMRNALQALIKIGVKPEVIVQAGLSCTNTDELLWALDQCGTNASFAPKVMSLLQHPDQVVRTSATNALNRITSQ